MASFPQAIEKSNDLFNSTEHGQVTDEQAHDQAVQLLSNVEEARGFFVALLTGQSAIADAPPRWLIEAMREQINVVAELLAKNLVMSTATKLIHERKGDAAAAAGSQTVATRTAGIIKKLEAPGLQSALTQLSSAVDDRLGEKDSPDSSWDAFLRKWGYDLEQLQAMKVALADCRS
ncbi:MAG TPA: hypothetical protein V6C81_26310 [Planktothrix sp.]|jgi:hypothetical protein